MFEPSTRDRPPWPDADALRREARDLLRRWRSGEGQALQRVKAWGRAGRPQLATAQQVVAREHDHPEWADLMAAAERHRLQALDDLAFAAQVLDAAIGRGWVGPRPRVAREQVASRRPVSLAAPGGLALALACGELDRVTGLIGPAPPARWLTDPLPPWQAPPLAYAVFSSLARLPTHHDALVATVHWLLARGADPNAVLRDPAYPDHPMPVLYGAVARAACVETTRALLDAGADPNDGESLYHAVEQRERQLVSLLVAAGAWWAGTGGLHRQLDFHDPEGLALVLSLGADPNEAGASGLRPLHHAVMRGRGPAAVRLLVEAGADPAARDDEGRTAADWAARLGDRDTLDLLAGWGVVPPSDVRSRFLAACAAADEATARALRATHPDLVATLDDEARRMLPDHARRGRRDAVRLMLELGWPVDAPGSGDSSALSQAALRGDADMVALLLAHGAHWEERNGFGGTVLGSCLYAAVHEPEPGGDYAGVLTQLLDHGAPWPDEDAIPDALLDVALEWQASQKASPTASDPASGAPSTTLKP